jgi:acetamidase/formamidase
MAVHRFQPKSFHNTIGAHAPALHISDGDTVITDTLDAHGFDAEGRQQGSDPNPMSGPFFVEGAEPGDALEVRIDRIDMNRATGWTRSGLAWHVVEPSEVRNMPARDKITWDIDRNGQRILLHDVLPALSHWSAPLDPMIGCLGVAPAEGQFISTATSGPYGGNMDYNRIKAGTTIRFPVSEKGALFFLGDVHGAQGDGEISGTGIETSAEVQFTVQVFKGQVLAWPRGETAEDIFTIGNARPLEQALQHATTEMLNWLRESYGLDRLAASHVLGMAVRYDVANVFNPAFSVACRVPKAALAGLAR